LAVMAALADVADRLESASHAIAELGPEIEGLGPWSLADQFGTEPEASWGPPELLAHVSEMLPYWLGEIERIVAEPPSADPVPFGRVSGDPVRIAIIGRDRTVPLRELLARISADSRRVGRRLRELDSDAEGTRHGLHPRLGELALPAIAERFLASHAAEHVLQLREILAAAQA
ncbi:MAG TPA: hypothetical protein VFP19_01850, partial [Candidatus Limnocylindrales bacterium]|nr:hypothetical protein [Candidatus Limnocylindrales bacterium]